MSTYEHQLSRGTDTPSCFPISFLESLSLILLCMEFHYSSSVREMLDDKEGTCLLTILSWSSPVVLSNFLSLDTDVPLLLPNRSISTNTRPVLTRALPECPSNRTRGLFGSQLASMRAYDRVDKMLTDRKPALLCVELRA